MPETDSGPTHISSDNWHSRPGGHLPRIKDPLPRRVPKSRESQSPWGPGCEDQHPSVSMDCNPPLSRSSEFTPMIGASKSRPLWRDSAISITALAVGATAVMLLRSCDSRAQPPSPDRAGTMPGLDERFVRAVLDQVAELPPWPTDEDLAADEFDMSGYAKLAWALGLERDDWLVAVAAAHDAEARELSFDEQLESDSRWILLLRVMFCFELAPESVGLTGNGGMPVAIREGGTFGGFPPGLPLRFSNGRIELVMRRAQRYGGSGGEYSATREVDLALRGQLPRRDLTPYVGVSNRSSLHSLMYRADER